MDKYEKISKVGEGAYAVVYKFKSKETGDYVAIKKFIDSEEDARIRKVALREIKMLKQLKHPNLINLIEAFRRKRRLHLVFEYCDRTVLNVLEKNPNGYPSNPTKILIFQLLQALQFCHEKNVIHRDVKPENILLNKDGVLKLCDFGFARTLGPEENLTDYVATRWYRAPELLVGDTRYGSSVDVWAIGCVLAELVTGKALWPGRSDLDMLYLIKKTIGELLPRHMKIFDANQYFKGSRIQSVNQRESLQDKLPSADQFVIDFLYKCFDRNPVQRYTCGQLLNHDYFRGFNYSLPVNELEKFHRLSQRAGQSNNLFPQLNASLNLSQSQDSLFDIKSQSYPVANLNRYDRLPNIGKNGLGINLTPPKRKQSI